MKTVPASEVKARLGDYLDQCATQGPVVISRKGKAVAVLLVPTDDEDLQRLLLARSPRFQAMLGRSRRSIKAGRGLTRDAFWQAVADRHRKKPHTSAK